MIDEALLARIFQAALRYGGEFSDVFAERRSTLAFRLQNGQVHEGIVVASTGVGIRVVCGESAGYAYSEDISEAALLAAAQSASLIARHSPAGSARAARIAGHLPTLYPQRESLGDAAAFAKLLERAESTARAADSRISAVNAHVADEVQEIWIATSDGRRVHDRRPMLTFGVQAIAGSGGQRGSGYAADGGRTSIEYFTTHPVEELAADAARIALLNMDARPAPSGEMEMIVGAGGGGVLLHEAVGHGLEGDFNAKGTSLYAGRIGERVASDLVTIYDDGNLPEERGSIACDDEGNPGAHTVLVENGILRGYLLDEINAGVLGMARTGNGRRQSFAHLPLPRMCNTYMPAGTSTLDEIISSTKHGIYAKSFAGGQVEISRGDFVFMIAEGYLVEDGRITAPIKNATIIGNGPDIMTRVTAVGHDAQLARRHYTCGKNGQYVPVGVGMPTVKISAVTVGGTADA